MSTLKTQGWYRRVVSLEIPNLHIKIIEITMKHKYVIHVNIFNIILIKRVKIYRSLRPCGSV